MRRTLYPGGDGFAPDALAGREFRPAPSGGTPTMARSARRRPDHGDRTFAVFTCLWPR